MKVKQEVPVLKIPSLSKDDTELYNTASKKYQDIKLHELETKKNITLTTIYEQAKIVLLKKLVFVLV
jgi:hypothetical protein